MSPPFFPYYATTSSPRAPLLLTTSSPRAPLLRRWPGAQFGFLEPRSDRNPPRIQRREVGLGIAREAHEKSRPIVGRGEAPAADRFLLDLADFVQTVERETLAAAERLPIQQVEVVLVRVLAIVAHHLDHHDLSALVAVAEGDQV